MVRSKLNALELLLRCVNDHYSEDHEGAPPQPSIKVDNTLTNARLRAVLCARSSARSFDPEPGPCFPLGGSTQSSGNRRIAPLPEGLARCDQDIENEVDLEEIHHHWGTMILSKYSLYWTISLYPGILLADTKFHPPYNVVRHRARIRDSWPMSPGSSPTSHQEAHQITSQKNPP